MSSGIPILPPDRRWLTVGSSLAGFWFSLVSWPYCIHAHAWFLACVQVTTHSHLLSREEVQRLAEELRLRKSGVFCYTLQEFDTELDFFAKVR